ncbi:MAG: hypothetical protein IJZ57_09520 [Clostridia bacterium]|nr:hypothetical protein [Clostridia bacterium]MBQ8783990.1 hypothetical protein [Clostridia bacterium]
MDYKNLAAWDKFAQSGKISDYLQYKATNSVQENVKNANEHRRADNQRAQDKRR